LASGRRKTSPNTTVYDPTCGSGSLLLKVADEARTPVTLYGQDKDATTASLSRMNMILHNNPTALVLQGNSLTDQKFKEGDTLKTFDYVVANPPFSDKRWSTGLDPLNDPYDRFKSFGVPPHSQGDYAYLLHIIRSLKSTGNGACIMPHGVLFRGNAEAEIRRNLVRKGYIKRDHWVTAEPLLWHWNPGMRRRDRQRRCSRSQRHIHHRCQPGLYEGWAEK
jgi:type I restriction enzyme M protein